MKVFLLCTVAIMGSVLPRIASQDIEAMTSQEWARASANWDQTMEAHRHRGNLSSGAGASCSSDIRSSFPTCLQYQINWCWATAVAELAHFYKPDDFPIIGNDCHGMECKIVGHKPTCSGSCMSSTKIQTLQQLILQAILHEVCTSKMSPYSQAFLSWYTLQFHIMHRRVLEKNRNELCAFSATNAEPSNLPNMFSTMC